MTHAHDTFLSTYDSYTRFIFPRGWFLHTIWLLYMICSFSHMTWFISFHVWFMLMTFLRGSWLLFHMRFLDMYFLHMIHFYSQLNFSRFFFFFYLILSRAWFFPACRLPVYGQEWKKGWFCTWRRLYNDVFTLNDGSVLVNRKYLRSPCSC